MTTIGEINLMIHLANRLRTMDEKQILELFHDMQDFAAVDRIATCANFYLENCPLQVQIKDEDERQYYDDEKDWKEQDDAQRYRDIKSTQDSMK